MDVDELRARIPALDETVYLNTGATTPSPRPVVDAVEDALEYHEYEATGEDGMYPAADEMLEDSRKTIAGFVGAEPEQVTLTQSTADGINLVAGGIDWGPDDRAVITDMEHPAGILPWKRRASTVDVLGSQDGRLDIDEYKSAVRGAKAVCFSSISWNYGTALPVAELVDIAREAGALTVVDAAQSVGQMPVDVGDWDADFTAGTSHKWALGPWGSGFLHVREGSESLLPAHRIGSKSVTEYDYETGEMQYEPGAKRFQSATISPPVFTGFATALDLLDDVGMETVAARIRSLTDRLKAGIDDDRLYSPRDHESGLVTIGDSDPEGTGERLSEEGIEIRSIPFPECIRVSVHGFNTESDVDALLAAL